MVVPTVTQQLAAVRNTLTKTVIPSLAADADFAREQAGLVVASLDWAMDVVESEHRYELTEHADQRALLRALLDADPGHADAGANELLARSESPPADLAGLRGQVRALKDAATAVFAALRARDDDASRTARAVVTHAARRQTERELAWARMTGFPRGAPPVAEVLAAQDGDDGRAR